VRLFSFSLGLRAIVIATMLCAAASLFAQVDAGAVRGTVTDPNGAVISHAEITLTNDGTGFAVSTLSGSDGTYTFNPVRIGSYVVRAVSPGFLQMSAHVAVDVQAQVRADFRMVPGGKTEHVEVTAVAPQLQTQDASLGAVATQQQINDLPLNGRNYTFLAQLNAGVTSLKPTRGLDGSGSFTANGLPSIHNNYILDGIDNNNDTVDFMNGAAYVNLPPPDAIQEFKLQTSNFSAEFGRAGGAVVNATVKSGTNQFHGSVWEFMRNDLFDAMGLGQYFTSPANKKTTELRRNQFGVAVGGPIRKNKTFFFVDYEGTRIVTGGSSKSTVPTNSESGSGYTDFSDLFAYTGATSKDSLGRTFNKETALDPATTRVVTKGKADPVTGLTATANGYVRDPFVGAGAPGIRGVTNFATAAWYQYLNRIPANRLDPVAIRLLQLYPAANAPGFTNNYQATKKTPDNSDHFDTRIDHNFSDRDQLFGRASYTNRRTYNPTALPASSHTFGSGNGNRNDHSLNLAISETHVLSPTLINEARFGYSHLYTLNDFVDQNVMGIPATYGIQGIPQVNGNGGLPAIGISGLTSLGAASYASPNWRKSDTYQATDNLTKILGGHSFKVGAEYQRLRFPWSDPATSHGSFSFGGYTGIPGVTNGIGMADLLLTPIKSVVSNGVDLVGGANAVSASGIPTPDDLRNVLGVYFQDDWKATRNLTLNLGIRWEYFGDLGDANGNQAGLISDANGANAQFVVLNSAKNLQLATSFTDLLAKDGIALKYVSSIRDTPKTNFAPRLGVAYQVTPKLVIRAGYGIFYSGFENVGGQFDPAGNYPFSPTFYFNRPDASHPITFSNGTIATIENGLNAVNLSPSSPQFVAQGLAPTAFSSHGTSGYTQEWNGSVQFQLTGSQTVTVSYVGNNSHHLLDTGYMNQPSVILPPGTPNTLSYDPYPDLGRNIAYLLPNGSAIYESGQISFERRFSNGLSLLTNFTQSVCKTDAHSAIGMGDQGDRALAYNLPGYGLHKAYEYCGSDAPHIFHASGIWELPVGRGKLLATGASRVVDGMIGGWSAQAIFTVQDGFPLTIGCPTPTTAVYGCNANVAPGEKMYSHHGPHGITQFLNPAAFSNPPVATAIGQSDYSPLGGPATQAHGPGYTNLDFSTFKRFRAERADLEFRAEFYNLLNHPNFSNSFATLDFTNPQFAQINGTRGNARQVQFALKAYF